MNKHETSRPHDVADDYDIDEVDEELVAYLDDELPAADRARIERRLADDETFRHHLRSLQATWDALDMLPKTTAGDAFAATTVQNVVAHEEVEVTQALKRVEQVKSRRWLWIGVVSGVAAAVGFGFIYRQETSNDRALLRDLPIVEKVDELRNTPSVNFLQTLQQEGLFAPPANET